MARTTPRISAFDLLGVIPLVADAIAKIGGEVDAVRHRRSDGGRKVTPEEGMDLAKTIHAALWPVAEYLVEKITADDAS